MQTHPTVGLAGDQQLSGSSAIPSCAQVASSFAACMQAMKHFQAALGPLSANLHPECTTQLHVLVAAARPLDICGTDRQQVVARTLCCEAQLLKCSGEACLPAMCARAESM